MDFMIVFPMDFQISEFVLSAQKTHWDILLLQTSEKAEGVVVLVIALDVELDFELGFGFEIVAKQTLVVDRFDDFFGEG